MQFLRNKSVNLENLKLIMVKVLHLSDIHMGSGFSHGKINPETGLNTRLEDFMQSLSQCV